MTNETQKLVLRNLLHNEDYARRVLPFLRAEYFEDSARTVFNLISGHIDQYNTQPTVQSIKVDASNLDRITQEDVELIKEISDKPERSDDKWLYDSTESWCQEQALYLAIMESISIIDGKHKTMSKNGIPEILKNALAISFDPNIGHDYIENHEARYDFYHRTEERIPFGLEMFDAITKGGLPRKTLNIALAGCVHPDTKIKVRMRKKV